MLTLTDTASIAIKAIVEQSPAGDGGGLRIQPGGDNSAGLQIAIVDAPEAADAVIEQEGARVFLEAQLALLLDDKVLDAQVDQEGAVRFALGEQPAAT